MTGRALQATAVGGAFFTAAAVIHDLDAASAGRLSITGEALGAAAACDLAERRIPNRVTVPAALALFVLLAATSTSFSRIAGGLAAAGLLLGIGLVRPTAIGMGDAKLALVVALGLTNKALIGAGERTGSRGDLRQRADRAQSRYSRDAIPLGPFFALGSLIALLM